MGRIRAVAIVINGPTLLVMHRKFGGRKYVTLPGGGVDSGETPEKTVIREIFEETTLRVGLGPLVYEHHYDTGEKQYYFICHYAGGQPKLSEDSNEFKSGGPDDSYKPSWLPIVDLPATLLLPLEIRDWLIKDLADGFPNKPRVAHLKFSELRQTI